MRRSFLAAAGAVAALLTSVAVAPSAGAAPSSTGLEHRNVPVCDSAPAGLANCDAVRHDTVDHNGKVVPDATAGPAGYGPVQLRSAYGLAPLQTTAPGALYGGKPYTASTRMIAIVDAYDAPSAEADLNVYRKQFGLGSCTTANGCFRKVDQTGKTRYPRANGGWAQEISLDLDMASSICPECRLLLVEANSASFADLSAAVRTAATTPGVVAISNSYGGTDLSNGTIEAAYSQPGIAVTASTGDDGYGVSAPASFTNVIAVGGTSLKADASTDRHWTESAWSGAGSGCSTAHATGFQDAGRTDCSGKANADVSAVADPNTGVAVYDSYTYQGARGWMVFGGTSAAAPMVAGFYGAGTAATGHQPAGSTYQPGAYLWATPTAGLNDVSGMSNGSCSLTKWCTAVEGWDGPTGLGSPFGLAAFSTPV
jgi:subtilase family serine protease